MYLLACGRQEAAVYAKKLSHDMKQWDDTVVNDLIRSWRRARLSSDSGALGYPRISILGKVVEMGGTAIRGGNTRPIEAESDCLTDADRVQSVVNKMPEVDRSAFEAYHLGIIRGDSCKGKPHKVRALILRISKKSYERGVLSAKRILQSWTVDLLGLS